MKKIILAFTIVIAFTSNAQKVTDTILIKMDTTTFNKVRTLIFENIDSRTSTGKLIIGNILQPLSVYTFLQPADKPKEIKPKQ